MEKSIAVLPFFGEEYDQEYRAVCHENAILLILFKAIGNGIPRQIGLAAVDETLRATSQAQLTHEIRGSISAAGESPRIDIRGGGEGDC